MLLGTVVKDAATALVSPTLMRTTMFNLGRYKLFASDQTYSASAIALVQRSTVIDMAASTMGSLSDEEKMIGHPENFTPEDFMPYTQSWHQRFSHRPWVRGRRRVHDTWFERVDTPARLDAIRSSGKVGILLGVQNAEHFRKLDDVDYFYGLGQRVSQLTYNERNLIGNGCYERRDVGLSDFGLAVVERMNKLGMAVDVSHCGDRTTLDAFDVSRKPVLVTHSNCRALNPGHPRCKTDEPIKAMAAKRGRHGNHRSPGLR